MPRTKAHFIIRRSNRPGSHWVVMQGDHAVKWFDWFRDAEQWIIAQKPASTTPEKAA